MVAARRNRGESRHDAQFRTTHSRRSHLGWHCVLRVVYLMFRRDPARAVALSRVLAREPLVSRVERWAGEVNVVAEVMTLNQEQLDKLIERFEPDQIEEVLTRVDRIRVPLRNLGSQLAATLGRAPRT